MNGLACTGTGTDCKRLRLKHGCVFTSGVARVSPAEDIDRRLGGRSYHYLVTKYFVAVAVIGIATDGTGTCYCCPVRALVYVLCLLLSYAVLCFVSCTARLHRMPQYQGY